MSEGTDEPPVPSHDQICLSLKNVWTPWYTLRIVKATVVAFEPNFSINSASDRDIESRSSLTKIFVLKRVHLASPCDANAPIPFLESQGGLSGIVRIMSLRPACDAPLSQNISKPK